MPYGRIRENTASLWMTKTNTGMEFPLDGQGGVTTTSESSLVASASASNPVIIEAVVIDYLIGTSSTQVNIREVGGTTDIIQVRFQPTVSEQTQYSAVGGPYGVRVDKPFRVRIGPNGLGSQALPYAAGGDQIGKVTIFFRYA